MKLAPKTAHQFLALVVSKATWRLCFNFVTERWPAGSEFAQGDYMYRGLRVAKVHPSPKQLMVTNDWPNSNTLRKKDKLGRFTGYIPLNNSRRLSYLKLHMNGSLSPETLFAPNADRLEFRIRKMEKIMELERASLPVTLGFDGRFRAVNGNHRLIAFYARDGHLGNLEFYITL